MPGDQHHWATVFHISKAGSSWPRCPILSLAPSESPSPCFPADCPPGCQAHQQQSPLRQGRGEKRRDCKHVCSVTLGLRSLCPTSKRVTREPGLQAPPSPAEERVLHAWKCWQTLGCFCVAAEV